MKRVFRFRSKRAPYIRAGVKFESNRTPVDVDAGEMTEDRLRRVHADPQISTSLVEVDDDGAETVVGALDHSAAWPADEPPPVLRADGERLSVFDTITTSSGGGGGQAASEASASGAADTAQAGSTDTPPQSGAEGDAAGAPAPAAEPDGSNDAKPKKSARKGDGDAPAEGES